MFSRVTVLLILSVGVLGSSTRVASAAEVFGDDIFYLGDPHAHTGASKDGGSADFGDCSASCGDFATVLETARDNGLDWVALSDHVNGDKAASEEDYARVTETAVDGNDPSGGFITVPAAEVWFTVESGALGHKTLLMFGDDSTLAGLDLADVQPTGGVSSQLGSCSDIWTWMDGLTAAFGPALLIPHHPALTQPMPTDWGCHSDAWEPEVEVYSGHGNSLSVAATFDPPWSGPTASGTVEAALDPAGYALRMGFMAGTDGHDTRPGSTCDVDLEMTHHPYAGGLTVAVIPSWTSFDRTALYEAILARHTYATTGPLVPLAIAWSSGGAALGGLGDELGLPAGQPLDVRVDVPTDRAAEITAVTLTGPSGTIAALTGDGAGTWMTTLEPDEVPEYLFVVVQMDGAVIYGSTEACADGGDNSEEWLWASPSWIDPGPGDVDGDGVTWADGDCDDGDPAIAPGSAEIWYDGIDQNCDGNDLDQDGDGAYPLSEGGVDCDDTNAAAHPGAEEQWYDGVDEDCSGDADDDQDADGWPAAVVGGADCDDADPAISPDAVEIWYDGIDQNCDGNDADQDGDGSPRPLDCDDGDPAVRPGSGGFDDACHAVQEGVITGAPSDVVESGGCATIAAQSGGAWLLALAGLVGRRRVTGKSTSA